MFTIKDYHIKSVGKKHLIALVFFSIPSTRYYVQENKEKSRYAGDKVSFSCGVSMRLKDAIEIWTYQMTYFGTIYIA